MDLLHKSVFSEQFILTRRAVQDVAKAVGKVQQAFLPQDLGTLLSGLEVWPEGIASQPFSIKNQPPERILINLQKGLVTWGSKSWSLRESDGPSLITDFQAMLTAKGVTAQLAIPDFTQEEAVYHGEFAGHLANLLWWAHGALERAKASVPGTEKLPLLLYPHNFDEAVQWDQTDDQSYTFGFSTGDETIADPYFYVTADPETNGFVSKTVPAPAYWQSEGFNGAVMRLQDFWLADDVSGRAVTFLKFMLNS